MTVDFEKLLTDLVKPLVVFPDDVSVSQLSEEDSVLTFQILVNKEDLGRVIGKNGKIANAIRTICYASASKQGKRIIVEIDSFE